MTHPHFVPPNSVPSPPGPPAFVTPPNVAPVVPQEQEPQENALLEATRDMPVVSRPAAPEEPEAAAHSQETDPSAFAPQTSTSDASQPDAIEPTLDVMASPATETAEVSVEAPEAAAGEAATPETATHETDAAEAHVTETDAPETEAHEAAAHEADAETDSAETDAAETDAPEAIAPTETVALPETDAAATESEADAEITVDDVPAEVASEAAPADGVVSDETAEALAADLAEVAEDVAEAKADLEEAEEELEDAEADLVEGAASLEDAVVEEETETPTEIEAVAMSTTEADQGFAQADEDLDGVDLFEEQYSEEDDDEDDDEGGALRPGDVEETTIAIWDPEVADRYREAWRDIQAHFVDEPEAALSEAQDLIAEAVQALADALLAEQVSLDPHEDTDTPDTEALRIAMRGYRDFLERVLAL